MEIRKIFRAVTCLSFFVLASCEILEQEQWKPDYLVSVNEIIKYPRASQVEKEIPTVAGTTKWISTSPYLFSNSIEKIETIPNSTDKNFFDLKMKLSYRGKLMWNQLCADISFKEMAFIVNDVLFRKLTPDMVRNEEGKDDIIIFALKLDPVTAKAIADASEKNFKYFNPEDERRNKGDKTNKTL
ncbi:MAG TPA: hypothetical protein PK821_03155 [Victivallales bacterium]|nr:hypothetical protein [Victivallales bacterium]